MHNQEEEHNERYGEFSSLPFTLVHDIVALRAGSTRDFSAQLRGLVLQHCSYPKQQSHLQIHIEVSRILSISTIHARATRDTRKDFQQRWTKLRAYRYRVSTISEYVSILRRRLGMLQTFFLVGFSIPRLEPSPSFTYSWSHTLSECIKGL